MLSLANVGVVGTDFHSYLKTCDVVPERCCSQRLLAACSEAVQATMRTSERAKLETRHAVLPQLPCVDRPLGVDARRPYNTLQRTQGADGEFLTVAKAPFYGQWVFQKAVAGGASIVPVAAADITENVKVSSMPTRECFPSMVAYSHHLLRCTAPGITFSLHARVRAHLHTDRGFGIPTGVGAEAKDRRPPPRGNQQDGSVGSSPVRSQGPARRQRRKGVCAHSAQHHIQHRHPLWGRHR